MSAFLVQEEVAAKIMERLELVEAVSWPTLPVVLSGSCEVEWPCMESRGAHGVAPLQSPQSVAEIVTALCFGSSRSCLVQNLCGLARVSYAEDQQGLIRPRFNPGVGIVNVDVGFPELGSGSR